MGPNANETTSTATSATNRLLLALGAFLLVLFVASNALLTHSELFWRASRWGGFTGPNGELVVEATLHLDDRGSRDVVFVGSSVVERDIDEARVSAAAGLPESRVLKLPLPGGTSLEIAMLTRQLIDRRPRVVVYLATPWTLRNDVEWDLQRLYDPVIALDIFSRSELLAQHTTHAGGLLAASHVVIRHRSSLRRILFKRLLRATAGGDVHEPDPLQIGRRARREREAATLDDFGCSNANVRALATMARRLSDAGITFVAVATPVSGRQGRDPELVRLVDECLASQARSTGFKFLPRSAWSAFPPAMFADALHMKPAGRDLFSTQVGRALATLDLGRQPEP